MYWGTCYSPGYRSASQTRAPARGHTRFTPSENAPAATSLPAQVTQRLRLVQLRSGHRLAVQSAEERQRRIGPQASLETAPSPRPHRSRAALRRAPFTASGLRDVISVAGITHRREAIRSGVRNGAAPPPRPCPPAQIPCAAPSGCGNGRRHHKPCRPRRRKKPSPRARWG